MGRVRLAALILVGGVLGCSRGKAPAPVETAAAGKRPGAVRSPALVAHTFELLSYAVAEPPSAGRDGLESCLYRSHPPGVQVLMLSDRESSTCAVKTGRVGVHYMHQNACTVLVGADTCQRANDPYAIGVIGSRGVYQRLERTLERGRPALERLERLIVESKAVEAATERWKDVIDSERAAGGAKAFGKVVLDAVSWPGVEGAPTLVRLNRDGDDGGGPWVALSEGKVVALIGPFSAGLPSAFELDGKAYLSVEVFNCTRCGDGGTQLHAIEGGKLRLVLESYANAN